jgi:hypothetical protein
MSLGLMDMQPCMCATLALQALYKTLQDPDGHFNNWLGSNPCEDGWEGIVCSDSQRPNNITYVIEL